jgi:ATP-dependent RNA helicase RhlE
LKHFNELGLTSSIQKALTAEGYTDPTPIQSKVIPVMMAGNDIVGIAQTGTGKTAAFVLPLLNRIAERKERPDAKHCSALILAPTRELASQIAESVRTYGRFMQVSVTVVVGGVKPFSQIKALGKGVDIVVATPGRLLDHMNTGVVHLKHTHTVVLDEADQMMDLGFMPAIRKILAKLPKERQTALLSATMPKQIRSLANDFLKSPTEISVAPTSRPIERITQKVIHLDRNHKRSTLTNLLKSKDVERAIVFTRTKRGADKVSDHLEKAGLNSAAIHGNKSQSQRERVLDAFKRGRVNILVATDIAARGIDIDDVSHVINFELPNVPEAYVHRIGRTARAGKSGIAISLCEHAERGLLRDIERLTGNTIERDVMPGNVENFVPREKPAGEDKPHGAARRVEGKKHKPRNRPEGQPNKAKKPHRGQSKRRNQSPDSGLRRAS